jgi:hypothetical protein
LSKKILDIIKKKQMEQIAAHMPAKDAPPKTADAELFEQCIDAAITAGRDTTREVEDDGFHPSSLGISVGKCGRRNVYLLRGVRKHGTHDARTLRVFANGHAVHDRLQKLFESMGIDAKSEIKIEYAEPPIRGHADGTIKWGGDDVLIEIKSCSDEVFINRLKWKKPKDEHFEQANIYAYILDIDRIFVIYENKNNQQLKVFEKKANREAAQKIIDDWLIQWWVHQEGKLPKRPYKPDSSVCAGCDVKYHCFADSEVGVDLKAYRKELESFNG